MKSHAIKGIQFHNQREKESETNPDINKDQSHLNYDLINGQKQIDYTEKINQVIADGVTSTKAIRKDAVRLSEFLITSDKEFFEKISPKEQKRYFETAHDFLADRYGEKNLIYATVHQDEKTPHMHVGFVPVTEDGRLSAKDFFGQKSKLVSLQDDFNQHLKENGFDLERGVSSSRKHLETSKYKALTFQSMEKESQEKYERTMGHIGEISDKTKSIEDIEAKKVLGLVGMKDQDYQSLVNYAKNGVALQFQNEQLQNELKKAQKEVVQLKSEMQIGQDKIRHSYKDVRENNEYLKENLEGLADKKAVEKVKQLDVVQKNRELIKDYNELVNKYNDQLKTKKEVTQKVSDLTFENRSYQNENRALKTEVQFLEEKVQSLTEKVLEISKNFSKFKETVSSVLDIHMDKILNWLTALKVDSMKIRYLDVHRSEFAKMSLEEMQKPQVEKPQVEKPQKQKERDDMELEL